MLAGRGGGRDSGLYVARALGVGETPKFALIARDAEDITADDLQPGSIVVLNDAQISSGAADRLGRFVERGGGLLVIAGQHGTWPQDRATVLPAGSRGSGGSNARAGRTPRRPRVWPRRLRAVPRRGDFSAARFYGYRATTLQPGANVLARFDDGAPALIERRAGAGRVLVWASSLDLQWNDLAVKPIFLPFMHQVARYLAACTEPEPWLTVGEVLDPAQTMAGSANEVRTVVSPSAARFRSIPKAATSSSW